MRANLREDMGNLVSTNDCNGIVYVLMDMAGEVVTLSVLVS